VYIAHVGLNRNKSTCFGTISVERVHLHVDINKCIINQFFKEYRGITSIRFLKLEIPWNVWDVFISRGVPKNDSDTFI